MAEDSGTGSGGASAVENGVKLVGEAVIPGGSLFLGGNIGEGALHLVGSAVATAFLGPLGGFLVSGNAFSRATTEKHLHEHAKDAVGLGG